MGGQATLRILVLGALVGCEAPAPCRLDARPASIDDAVATIGLLPSPVSLECFLESLERPLGLELSSDVFSAQPAQGMESSSRSIRTPLSTG